MRDNLVKHGMKYCQSSLFEALFLSYRIRNSPKSDFDVLRAHLGRHPDFLDHISMIDAWALLQTFWTSYPELVEGMDPRSFMVSS